MNLLLIPLVFILVLIAELPDKSMFASLMLATRFPPRWVFLGVASAFLVHVTIAVVAGGLLSLLPRRILEIVVAVLFLIGAVVLWREAGGKQAESTASEHQGASRPASPLTAYASSFGVIFVGEWGDITQILTANLAAKYADPVAVGIGATLGLWTAALLAITAGRSLLRRMSMTLLQRIGALILLGFAGYTIVAIIRG